MINYYTYRGYGEIISGPYKGKQGFIANFWNGKTVICVCDYSGISFSIDPKDVSLIFEHYLDYSI